MTTISDMVESYIKHSVPDEMLELGDGYKYWRGCGRIYRMKVNDLEFDPDNGINYEIVYELDNRGRDYPNYDSLDKVLIRHMIYIYRTIINEQEVTR